MNNNLRRQAEELVKLLEAERLEKLGLEDMYIASVVDQNLYENFKSDALSLLSQEAERLSLDFNFEKDYSKEELSELLVSPEKDIEKLRIWLDEVKWRLRALWNGGDPPNQDALNTAYFMLSTLICERKGGPLAIDEQKIKALSVDLSDIDKRCAIFCRQRFTFYKPRYGEKVVPKNTINLRIDDTFLKFRAFFAASISSFIHILRNVCDADVGFLSRMILSRSLLEVAIHNLFVVRKLHSIAKQIGNENENRSIEILERFRNVFYRGMFGTTSPLEPTSTDKPYNILTCLQFLEKEPINDLPYKKLSENYEHLCDFTHPNLLMRRSLSDIVSAKGDVFCDEVLIDITHKGKSKSPENLKHLVTSLECCVILMNTAFTEKAQLRQLLDEKSLSNKDEHHFNKVTATT